MAAVHSSPMQPSRGGSRCDAMRCGIGFSCARSTGHATCKLSSGQGLGCARLDTDKVVVVAWREATVANFSRGKETGGKKVGGLLVKNTVRYGVQSQANGSALQPSAVSPHTCTVLIESNHDPPMRLPHSA